MPVSAKVYWALVVFLGSAAIALSQILPLPRAEHSPWEVAAFALLAILFGGQKIVLHKLRNDEEEAMSMTLGFAVTFACLMRLGPAPTVPISVLSCISSCIYPRPQALHQFIFNISLCAIEALVGGVVFSALNGWSMILEPGRTFVAVLASSLCFFAVNTAGVAAIISLVTKASLVKVWRENFAWTAPSYLASGCMGALAMLLFYGSSTAIVLFMLPLAYVLYRSFAITIARTEEKQRHIEELQKKQAQLEDLYLATIKSMALAVDAKDQYTHQHILRVQRYAVALAEELGLEGDELQGVRTGALLHDIGKLGIPEHVLLKPGPLTREEFEIIKKHPEIGAAILEPVDFPWPVLPSVKYHHERWNGSGYPEGLKGEEIPITARIMAVADVYDAVTSNRSYRHACTHEEALDILRQGAGVLFDPVVVEAFLKIADRVVDELRREGLRSAGAGTDPTPRQESLAS